MTDDEILLAAKNIQCRLRKEKKRAILTAVMNGQYEPDFVKVAWCLGGQWEEITFAEDIDTLMAAIIEGLK